MTYLLVCPGDNSKNNPDFRLRFFVGIGCSHPRGQFKLNLFLWPFIMDYPKVFQNHLREVTLSTNNFWHNQVSVKIPTTPDDGNLLEVSSCIVFSVNMVRKNTKIIYHKISLGTSLIKQLLTLA